MKALAEGVRDDTALPSVEGQRVKAVVSKRDTVSRLLGRIIFAGLLAIITLSAIPYGTNESWWVALFECAVFALGALWAIDGYLSGSWLAGGRALVMPLLLIALYAFMQTVPWRGLEAGAAGVGPVWSAISADPYETRLFLLKFLALVIAFALLLRYTSSQRRLRALVYIVIGIAIASALFGLFRQAAWNNAPVSFLPRLKPDVGYAQFINKNHFAFLIEMALGLTLGLAVGILFGARRERLLIYLAASLPLWITLVLAGSRGGVFTMVAELVFLALMAPPLLASPESVKRRASTGTWLRRFGGSFAARMVLIVCLVVGGAASIVWIGGDPLLSRLETMPGEFTSAEGGAENVNRLEIWRATWRLIKSHPVMGSGFGAYWIAIAEYHRGSGRLMPQEAHNDYLELMASGGIIALLLAGWFIVAFIKRVRLTLRTRDSFGRAASLGALVGLFAVSLHSFVDFGLHITANSLVCIALIVIATVQVRVEAEEGQSGQWQKGFASSVKNSYS